jgi:hypothetical protein
MSSQDSQVTILHAKGNTMTYTKPEINPLGDAARRIQLIGKAIQSFLEAFPYLGDPAYDLDD